MGSKHNRSTKNLRIAFFLNLGFTILEFIGGMYVNSIAIISDAIHDLGDSLSLGTAWYLQEKSKQGSDARFSFGYARFSLLGALINSLILIAGSVFILYEAIERILAPQSSNAVGMMIFAGIGILVNGYAAWKLSGSKTLNEKVVSLHLLEDVLGWVAVLIAAIVLKFTDSPYIDPVLSMIITLYILWGVFKRLKETLFLFLQGVPNDIDLPAIEARIQQIEHIQSIHHTRIWSLEGEHHVFTTHVCLENIQDFEQTIEVKKQIKRILKEYHFQHYTIETEYDHEKCDLMEKDFLRFNP